MFRAATAPDFRPPRTVRRHSNSYPLVRRDPRRFARGMVRLGTGPAEPAGEASWRFFAQSFAATFLFVSLLIA